MVTRITGMASGMDIDGMVKKLMKAESAPLTKMNQQKQLMEWKRESYREASTKLVTFLQDKIKDSLSKATTIDAQKATITGNTTALTAVASSSASGVMNITVNKLATASSAVTNAVDADGNKVSFGKEGSSTTLASLGINASSVKIGAADIAIDSTDTIDTFVQKINNNKTAGVTALYDKDGGLSLTSKTTGSAAVTVDASVTSAFKLASTNGQNANITVNGLSIDKASNNFDLNGVAITLNSAGGPASTVSISKDTDKIVSAVQSFVDAYNDVTSSLNSKISEERYKKYTPLSTEERAAMSDDEAKLWNDKAKSGMLKNDSILQDAVSEMRMAMVQGVTLSDGTKLSMVDLGITTGTYETKGKLLLDTDKLKAALEKDPTVVTDFFTNDYSKSFLNNNVTETDGILAKLQKVSTVALKRMNETAGTSTSSKDITASFMSTSTMGEQLTSLNRRISDFTSKLNTIETNYYKKFTAMETAINKYNTQSSNLAGM
ncbi:flagellar cap protein FliD [Saccharibacillus sp. O16]|nr:flagellar cap protein FliD [Saccharibacillus sp. O16]